MVCLGLNYRKVGLTYPERGKWEPNFTDSYEVEKEEEFRLKKAELECEERLRREDMDRPYGGFVREREVKLPTFAEMDEVRKRFPKKLSPLQQALANRKNATEGAGLIYAAAMSKWAKDLRKGVEDPGFPERHAAMVEKWKVKYPNVRRGDEAPLPPPDAPKFADEEDGGETPRAHEVPDTGCGLAPSTETGGVRYGDEYHPVDAQLTDEEVAEAYAGLEDDVDSLMCKAWMSLQTGWR